MYLCEISVPVRHSQCSVGCTLRQSCSPSPSYNGSALIYILYHLSLISPFQTIISAILRWTFISLISINNTDDNSQNIHPMVWHLGKLCYTVTTKSGETSDKKKDCDTGGCTPQHLLPCGYYIMLQERDVNSHTRADASICGCWRGHPLVSHPLQYLWPRWCLGSKRLNRNKLALISLSLSGCCGDLQHYM